MSKSKSNSMQSKRFVIRKNLIGKGVIVEFTKKDGSVVKYDHDAVYNANKAKFEAMNCFKKYKSYTATNNLPTFAREFVVD
jgi:hypothetical protein